MNEKERAKEIRKILENATELLEVFREYLEQKEERKDNFFNSVGYAVMYLLYSKEANAGNIPWDKRAKRYLDFLAGVSKDIPNLVTRKVDC